MPLRPIHAPPSSVVQGGYNAVLHPSDSLDQHFHDTIEGGAYLNDQELAWILIATAPERIRELENRMGCFFDRNPDGTIIKRPLPDSHLIAPCTVAT
jgi:succinate dehydrogenase/fumarate reductase flavoprotein subunit